MSDYLWDRSGIVDAEVAELEARLGALAFDPKTLPFTMPGTVVTGRFGRRRLRWMIPAGLVAASVIIGAGLAAWHSWRLDWQTDRAWAVNGGQSLLPVGGTLDVQSARARVDIARLGVLEAAPGTSLSLSSTGAMRHRLMLDRGEIDVRVWAPPGRVGVRTPAGDVIDMGCIFRLSVGADQVARVHVDTGWVNLSNAYGNSYVPAGASSEMRAGAEPLVPLYDDAASLFREGVRAVEANTSAVDMASLRAFIPLARLRDALTLLMLSDQGGLSAEARTAILERMQALVPPPAGVTIPEVVAGNRDAFWKWYDALNLPPLKNWWANWRDVIPR
jgi:hypothetical protein